METLTHRRRWKTVTSKETVATEAHILELSGQPDCVLPSSALVLASEQNRANAGGVRRNEPGWIEVRNLTTRHFIGVPADFQSPGTQDISVVSAYLAGCIIADGVTDENSCKTPAVLNVPGMGQMMMRSALSSGILKGSGAAIRPGKELRKVIRMILEGDENLSLLGTDEKLAICRGWMESHSPRTPARKAVLTISRLMRSMMRETHALSSWKTDDTAFIHTLTPVTPNFRNGMMIEAGMGWLRVKTGIPASEKITYEKYTVEDDDSHVYDGIYVRDCSVSASVV